MPVGMSAVGGRVDVIGTKADTPIIRLIRAIIKRWEDPYGVKGGVSRWGT